MNTYKVQVIVHVNNKSKYYDVYIKGSNIYDVRLDAINFVKKSLDKLGYSKEEINKADVGLGAQRPGLWEDSVHEPNSIYDGDWYGHDELLYKGGDE